MILNELKNKKILILGFGREGKDTFRFLRKLFPEKVLGIADRQKVSSFKFQVSSLIKKNKKVKIYLGKDYLKALKNYDIIIKAPGIPIHLPEIEKSQKAGKITSQTEIFFENCPGKIIGITGTKGKGTTSLLIYKILKQRGLKVHLIGNIGKPALRFLSSATAKSIYVYELSSHQLYNLKKSPQIAVFLNIYPDHLDYYKDFKEYAKSEQKIAYCLTKDDYLIFNPSDKLVLEAAKISKAKKIPINPEIVEKFIKIKDIPLEGKFHFLNMAAAIETAKLFEITKEKISKTIRNFKSLPHRLQYVGKYQGIKFYDDSAATIPQASIAALDALGNNVETIFLGGSDKGLDFKNLAKRVLRSKIKNVILFPPNGKEIWQALRLASFAQSKKLPRYFFIDNMPRAVKLAYEHTQKRKICLLSCASASFGCFRDYKERGNLFKKYVKKYAKK